MTLLERDARPLDGELVARVHRAVGEQLTTRQGEAEHQGRARRSRADERALSRKLKDVPVDVLINNAANTSTGQAQHFGQLDYAEGRDVLVACGNPLRPRRDGHVRRARPAIRGPRLSC